MARPTKEELEILEPITSIYGTPNLVTDIFKVRSGEWTQVRIWSIASLGTLKRVDLFITDSRLDIIENFFNEEDVIMHSWDDDEYQYLKKRVSELNGL